MNYTIIGHMETFADDLAYLLWKTGLANTVVPLKAVLTERRNRCPHQGSTTEEYMATLTPQQKSRLYEVYGDDFELFGYSPDVFLDS